MELQVIEGRIKGLCVLHVASRPCISAVYLLDKSMPADSEQCFDAVEGQDAIQFNEKDFFYPPNFSTRSNFLCDVTGLSNLKVSQLHGKLISPTRTSRRLFHSCSLQLLRSWTKFQTAVFTISD